MKNKRLILLKTIKYAFNKQYNENKSISNINERNKNKYHLDFKNNLKIERDYQLNGFGLLTNNLSFEDAK